LADEKAWKDAFSSVTSQIPPLPALTGTTEPRDEDLELVAEMLTEAAEKANDAKVPIRKPSTKAKPWWTADLKKIRDELRQARQESLTYFQLNNEACEHLVRKGNTLQEKFNKAVRRTRAEWVERRIQETDQN